MDVIYVTCEYCQGAGEHYDEDERCYQQCLMCLGSGMLRGQANRPEEDEHDPWY